MGAGGIRWGAGQGRKLVVAMVCGKRKKLGLRQRPTHDIKDNLEIAAQ